MRYTWLSIVVCWCVLISQVDGFQTTEQIPDGPYCGEYSHGIIKGRMMMKSNVSLFDMDIVAFGSATTCVDEPYVYYPETHRAEVVNAQDSNDCVGEVLEDNHLSLEVTYNPAKDIIILDFGMAKINCKKCK